MPVTARLRYLRIAPRKVRLMADLIRRKRAEEAQTILNFARKKAGLPLLRLLNQAIANAKDSAQLDPGNLFISKITVDEGPKYKRWRARSRGQAAQIQKKTSHITLILDEIEKGKRKKKVPAKKPVPVKAAAVKEEKKDISPKIEKPKPRPGLEIKKPKAPGGLARIFRRKAI